MALAEPLVSVSELATYMKATFAEGSETDQADMVLRVVSEWARTIGGKRWNNTDLLPPGDVVGVVLSASRRELTNPDRVITESMGPLSVTRARPPEGFFTPGELQILRKKSKGSLFTVSTRREEREWSTGYIHMREDLSDEAIPYLNYGEPGWGNTIHL